MIKFLNAKISRKRYSLSVKNKFTHELKQENKKDGGLLSDWNYDNFFNCPFTTIR